MRKSCLRWFGCVQMRATNVPVRKSELIQVKGTKKVRLKIALVEVIKKDMSVREATESMTSNRIEWRKRIHVTYPN